MRELRMFLPDPLSLRCFLAVAERLSFRAAARAVGLSPPALSERIRRLEDDLGSALFTRDSRTVAVTDAGLRLLPQARRAVAALAACARVVARDDAPLPFALTVGTRYELGLSWLLPALERLSEARPERQLHLQFGQHVHLLDALRARSIDAVITSARLTDGGLRTAHLHDERYVLVGAPDAAPFCGPAHAAGRTLVDAAPDLPLFRYLQDAVVGGADWPFARTELMGTLSAIATRVRAGVGIAVLPEYYVRSDLAAERLVQLWPEAPIRSDAFRLVWRAGAPHDAELGALAEELRAIPLR